MDIHVEPKTRLYNLMPFAAKGHYPALKIKPGNRDDIPNEG
jgi:hypothetical protein